MQLRLKSVRLLDQNVLEMLGCDEGLSTGLELDEKRVEPISSSHAEDTGLEWYIAHFCVLRFADSVKCNSTWNLL